MKKADQTRGDDTYPEAETKARAEATLKRMLATPPKPHKSSKQGRERSASSPKG